MRQSHETQSAKGGPRLQQEAGRVAAAVTGEQVRSLVSHPGQTVSEEGATPTGGNELTVISVTVQSEQLVFVVTRVGSVTCATRGWTGDITCRVLTLAGSRDRAVHCSSDQQESQGELLQ